ncbi:MAG: TolC family protein, partial [Bacteroidaceae bacterium]|nr:TolC family protein [Bacteroidaceae bacterium]
ADATNAYLQSLKAKAILETARKREEYMSHLSQSDSLRFVRGEIAKTAWIETRLAAGLARNQRLTAEAEYRNSIIRIGYYMGDLSNAQNISVSGTLEESVTTLEGLDIYIGRALEHRSDLLVAYHNVEIAEAEKRLNSARRRIDLNLSLGAEYNFADPSFTHLAVGAAIPLKFSNINKGERNRDRAKVEKANREVADTRLQIESEVMQAYNNCIIAEMQIETFTAGMLAETAELLASKRRAYEQGEISFVEFIETERSENMMQEEFIEAIYNKAACWVELQRSIGHRFDEAGKQ